MKSYESCVAPRDFKGWSFLAQMISGPEQRVGGKSIGWEPLVRGIVLSSPLPGISAPKVSMRMIGNQDEGYKFRVKGSLPSTDMNMFVLQPVDCPGQPDYWLGCSDEPVHSPRVWLEPLWSDGDTAPGLRTHEQAPLTYRELELEEQVAFGGMMLAAAYKHNFQNVIQRLIADANSSIVPASE